MLIAAEIRYDLHIGDLDSAAELLDEHKPLLVTERPDDWLDMTLQHALRSGNMARAEWLVRYGKIVRWFWFRLGPRGVSDVGDDVEHAERMLRRAVANGTIDGPPVYDPLLVDGLLRPSMVLLTDPWVP